MVFLCTSTHPSTRKRTTCSAISMQCCSSHWQTGNQWKCSPWQGTAQTCGPVLTTLSCSFGNNFYCSRMLSQYECQPLNVWHKSPVTWPESTASCNWYECASSGVIQQQHGMNHHSALWSAKEVVWITWSLYHISKSWHKFPGLSRNIQQ